MLWLFKSSANINAKMTISYNVTFTRPIVPLQNQNNPAGTA